MKLQIPTWFFNMGTGEVGMSYPQYMSPGISAQVSKCCGSSYHRRIGDIDSYKEILNRFTSTEYKNEYVFTNFLGIQIADDINPNWRISDTEKLDTFLLENKDGKLVPFYVRSLFKVKYAFQDQGSSSQGCPAKINTDLTINGVYFNGVKNITREEWIEQGFNITLFAAGKIEAYEKRFELLLDPNLRYQFYILADDQLGKFDDHMEKYDMKKWLIGSRGGIVNLNYPEKDNPRLNWFLFDLKKG